MSQAGTFGSSGSSANTQAILLSTKTASSSASISFGTADGIGPTYTNYQVIINDLVSSTNNTPFWQLWSTNNGVSYLNSGYRWGFFFNIAQNGGTGQIGNATDTQIEMIDVSSNVNPMFATFDYYNLGVSGQLCAFSGDLTYSLNAVSGMGINSCVGSNSTTGINNIKFLFEAGNIASGTFYLFGLKY